MIRTDKVKFFYYPILKSFNIFLKTSSEIKKRSIYFIG